MQAGRLDADAAAARPHVPEHPPGGQLQLAEDDRPHLRLGDHAGGVLEGLLGEAPGQGARAGHVVVASQDDDGERVPRSVGEPVQVGRHHSLVGQAESGAYVDPPVGDPAGLEGPAEGLGGVGRRHEHGGLSGALE